MIRSFKVEDRGTNQTITLDLQSDDRPQLPYLVSSPVDADKKFPEKFVSGLSNLHSLILLLLTLSQSFDAETLDLGVMLSPTDMVAMFTTQKNFPVKFSVNLKRRRIEVSFHHEFKAPPQEDTAYRSLFAQWQKMKKRAAREQEEQEREEALLEQAVEEGSKQDQKESGPDEQEESNQEEQEEEDELSDIENEQMEAWERSETYRFEIRFEHLSALLEEPSEDMNTRIFSFSLPFPPEFSRRLHNTHRSFTDPNARHWSEWDSWFRQTVITFQEEWVHHLPITLRQPYAIIDIGKFSHCYRYSPSSTDNFVRSMDHLPVCVQVTTEQSNTF